ncbi:MAG: BON domain-containing protein [Bdellovibrionales bacterium]
MQDLNLKVVDDREYQIRWTRIVMATAAAVVGGALISILLMTSLPANAGGLKSVTVANNPPKTNVTEPAPETSTAKTEENLAQEIREEISKMPSLSTEAQKVSVTAQNGEIQLSGVVKSEAEKNEIENVARRVAGFKRVTNRLRIQSM